MSTRTQTPPPTVAATGPTPRRWTREEFYRLADAGFFIGQKVERIGGELIMSASPQDWAHFVATDRTVDALKAAFGPGFWVRGQGPLEFGLDSDPEPDVSVAAGPRDQFAGRHPTAAVLVVEVANTTLWFDRGQKASLYAAAGVPDYWVLDVVGRRLEVCRGPQPDAAQPHGWGYADRRWLAPTDSVAPLAAPAASVGVAALLG